MEQHDAGLQPETARHYVWHPDATAAVLEGADT
jgi:hypothetical protein